MQNYWRVLFCLFVCLLIIGKCKRLSVEEQDEEQKKTITVRPPDNCQNHNKINMDNTNNNESNSSPSPTATATATPMTPEPASRLKSNKQSGVALIAFTNNPDKLMKYRM